MDRKMKRTTSVRHTVKPSKAQWGTVGLSLMLAKTSMLQKMGKMEATVSLIFPHLPSLFSLFGIHVSFLVVFSIFKPFNNFFSPHLSNVLYPCILYSMKRDM